ncbi:hypothetical protein [Mangrovihabitans endophyticus]|uniref:Homeodomain-like domain-containing protein n=1 Tax=Mangrovihabitans endophyticus TaxID=1751298 RepID=A0A8J3FNZ8_9ACTN|nr:hypothetical protein [Mangrovihabitans endophyticus]GGK88221.1 hypothetical protein GCM10012284_22880 [Mangrovihabitans endophyticus]
MNDIEHLPAHVILDRSVVVGDSTYRVAATDAGDRCVDVTVIGVDRDGRIVSEIGGGISHDDLPIVAELLMSTLTALTVLGQPPEQGRPQRAHPNQGGRWTREDDQRLLARHREGASDRELMAEFGRSRGGIRLRLERLGAIPAAVG